MTDTKSYPYVTHLDIKFPSLDLIDVEALAKSVTDQWYNQALCRCPARRHAGGISLA